MTNKVAFINENDNDSHLDLQVKYAGNIKKKIMTRNYLAQSSNK